MAESSNPHAWRLADLAGVPRNGLKVASTFACGGGSSMGYKRAGYDVVAANDIDPKMRAHYEKNLHPPAFYEGPVLDLAERDLPPEMFDLDVLDGSPPCSTFSMAGSREKAWGKEKHFKEGQAVQVLDDLFFDFLRVVERLRPRAVVAENVKGMVAGNAKGYVRAVFDVLRGIGYRPQIFLVNAAYCGVPQRRERVFICAVRDDVSGARLEIETGGVPITFAEATSDLTVPAGARMINEETLAHKYWRTTLPGKSLQDAYRRETGRPGWHGHIKIHPEQSVPTLVSGNSYYHDTEPRFLTDAELVRLGSFPDDYAFDGKGMAKYLVGMSVPPKMMQRVAESVRDAWLT